MAESVVVYAYARCETCRKALAWLKARGVAFQAIDIVENPPSEAVLLSVLERTGVALGRLFNTSGQSYREGGFKDRLKSLDTPGALKALAADGKLIKRPLVVAPGFALIGFSEEQYAATFTR
jgi:arsenate reductase (glutaredoxin)